MKNLLSVRGTKFTETQQNEPGRSSGKFGGGRGGRK